MERDGRQAVPRAPGAFIARAERDGPTECVLRTAITSSQIIATGVLNLVRSTLITALAGARDVGAEMGWRP
jgi:hypothetical protein